MYVSLQTFMHIFSLAIFTASYFFSCDRKTDFLGEHSDLLRVYCELPGGHHSRPLHGRLQGEGSGTENGRISGPNTEYPVLLDT